MKNFTIDATGKSLGRVASQAASILIGKNSSEFEKNKAPNVKVLITNAGKAKVSDIKAVAEKYTYFSGHAGGLREETRKRLIERQGMKKVFWFAVYGMLPTNKLRAKMIKNLTVKE